MKRIENLSDRELMEHLYAAQIVLMQKLYRINDFLLHKEEDLVKYPIHKDETIKRLDKDIEDVWRQYRSIKDEE